MKSVNTSADDTLQEILRSSGTRVTRHRIDVLRHLIETGRPMSHAEIQILLPELDRVTLYRTLSSFVDAGIAHQVQGPDGSWRFCAHHPGKSDCPGNHPHFLCLACGKMFCLIDQRLPRINVPEGCEVRGKQVVIFGKCPSCFASDKIYGRGGKR